MSILVTGDLGFVGSYVCARGRDCVGLSTLSTRSIDIADLSPLKSALSSTKIDAVIHLAAQTFVPDSIDDPTGTYDANFIGTHNLFVALKAVSFSGRVLFVSSADVYGVLNECDLPATENALLQPLNPYAVSKIAAEALCRYWFLAEGFDVVIARPFNHIGPAQSTRFAVADFSKIIAEVSMGRREPRLAVGDLDVTRDFTDVRDVVDAYFLLLSRGRAGEIYNVCSGVERNLGAAVHELAELAGVSVTLEIEPARLRKVSQRRAVGSADKLRLDTGWRQAVPWTQSLQDMIEYWKRKLND